MKKYRGTTYANNSSGWVLLDAAEQVFKLTKERVYNDKDGKFILQGIFRDGDGENCLYDFRIRARTVP